MTYAKLRINKLRDFRILSSSWFERMSGSVDAGRKNAVDRYWTHFAKRSLGRATGAQRVSCAARATRQL